MMKERYQFRDARETERVTASRFGLQSRRGEITRVSVTRVFTPFADRLIAALCALLMMFYAATVPARAIDQIQHSPALMVSHEHGGDAAFGLDAVHDDLADHEAHHEKAPDADDQPGEHFAGGHHHHGDGGSNLLVPGGAYALAHAAANSLHGPWSERQIDGQRPGGPERPPRYNSLSA